MEWRKLTVQPVALRVWAKTYTAVQLAKQYQVPLVQIFVGRLYTSTSPTAGVPSCSWTRAISTSPSATNTAAHNVLVSMFLRHRMETFRGIAMITTNTWYRKFDRAMIDRVHQAVRYRPPSFANRKELWCQTKLTKEKWCGGLITDDDGLKELAKYKLNGREGNMNPLPETAWAAGEANARRLSRSRTF
ncbi:hypothetical protein B0T24DRAFT_598114 [Lasiosphaeria ovina]|uniref:Uncharacterized protein n=1 Tax=Lasiosphaeria ovina TaxID=92902 RepID=A0AAE0MZ34_9PEZI|nr:hypothetical protein B0T24DRAFT_598114 [Lasiosphaeria ovina]